ncbi:MAG: hypothetical protein R2827_13990 [Bdellovibrionales bacterium]
MRVLISILVSVFAYQALGYEIQGTVRKHDPSNPYAPEIVEVTAEELWSLDSTVRISQGSKFVGTGTLVVRPDVVLTKYHTFERIGQTDEAYVQWRPTVRGQHGQFYVNWSKSICNVEKDYCVLALKNPVDYPGVKVQQVADGEKIALDPNDPNKFGDVVTSAFSTEIPAHLYEDAEITYEINQQSYFKKRRRRTF